MIKDLGGFHQSLRRLLSTRRPPVSKLNCPALAASSETGFRAAMMPWQCCHKHRICLKICWSNDPNHLSPDPLKWLDCETTGLLYIGACALMIRIISVCRLSLKVVDCETNLRNITYPLYLKNGTSLYRNHSHFERRLTSQIGTAVISWWKICSSKLHHISAQFTYQTPSTLELFEQYLVVIIVFIEQNLGYV